MTNEMANSHWLLCPKCRSPLPPRAFQEADKAQCPSCWTDIEAHVFPSLFRPIQTGSAADAVMVEGESSCFYHPAKKAVVPCDSCGRFLCALCDVDFNSQHLCAPCIESGRKKGRQHHLENQRMRYDLLALALTVAPLAGLITWPLMIMTAPCGIFVACRYWNAPTGLMVRGVKWRMALAVVSGLVGVGLWLMFAVSLFLAEIH
jgi:hypothetical protein